ncbi:hypothetical protein PanWU01x14_025080 [Parasponia andersonii]|uniref:Uncharacterized protein n=1 Tax=Parasponia andersonii TaxID=3476 RepID=A0A2P5DWV6_PARAD|nr:hypothetical protein PanWU01x14_025080 [Parasponia andersonii]
MVLVINDDTDDNFDENEIGEDMCVEPNGLGDMVELSLNSAVGLVLQKLLR